MCPHFFALSLVLLWLNSCCWGLQLWWTICHSLTCGSLSRVSQVDLPPCRLSNPASPAHWLVEPENAQMNSPIEKITFSRDTAEPLCQRLCCCEQTIFFSHKAAVYQGPLHCSHHKVLWQIKNEHHHPFSLHFIGPNQSAQLSLQCAQWKSYKVSFSCMENADKYNA